MQQGTQLQPTSYYRELLQPLHAHLSLLSYIIRQHGQRWHEVDLGTGGRGALQSTGKATYGIVSYN